MIFSKPNSFNAEIVRENSAISGLEDGKVYVLAARTDLFVDAVKTAIKHFKNLMDNREGLIYHYDISVIENVESVITSLLSTLVVLLETEEATRTAAFADPSSAVTVAFSILIS